jgi:PleD family two-component response regulator
MRILVAEDDVTSRHILTVMLTKWGFTPLVTEDGDAAWAALQQADAPKLVLLDRNMPGIDGLEICRRLRLTESSNPAYVILLTGQGEKEDIVGGLEAGANDYVTKPYHNAELQARIRVGQRMLELQTHLVEARDALAFQATHDALTGVLNRRAIMDRAKAELVRQQRDERVLVSSCATSTTSSASTIPMAIRSATRFWSASPAACRSSCAPTTTWVATAARSSWY